jgi:sugar fermentation stimulation protein A
METLSSPLVLFPNARTARFIKRLNRFVIECAVDGRTVMAHLPNPGRLWELLLPGRTVYLTEEEGMSHRTTRYTAVAVERDGTPIVLHTHQTNEVVKWLIERSVIPGLERAEIIRHEATVGNSRFDFLLMNDGVPLILEVKSCTLFGRTIAMFPDAVTARGTKHLRELANLSKAGTKTAVIFLCHWNRARWFLPDYHTDLEFARTLLASRQDVAMKPVAVEWNDELALSPTARELSIPWDLMEQEVQDRGSYLIMLHLPADSAIAVGKRGTVRFPKGYYLYAGSAAKHLTKRIQRHMRKQKTFHWHIDYLREHAGRCVALPVRSSEPLEHELAAAVSAIADWPVAGFGASDCSCDTHLFGMHENPLHNKAFIDLLLDFRINRLEKSLQAKG